jgi:hypothetical protein
MASTKKAWIKKVLTNLFLFYYPKNFYRFPNLDQEGQNLLELALG